LVTEKAIANLYSFHILMNWTENTEANFCFQNLTCGRLRLKKVTVAHQKAHALGIANPPALRNF
jgi:hypothetical protein